MRVFDELIHLSAKASSIDKLPFEPFLLKKGLEKKPTKFEITFIIKQDRYRYGFEYNENIISKEWLYRKSLSREVALFLREKDVIENYPGLKGNKNVINAAIEATRNNALFISFCDAFNIEEAKTIFQWFGNFNITDGLNTDRDELTTISIMDNKKYRKKIEDYLDRFNFGFDSIEVLTKEFDESDLPQGLSKTARKRLTNHLRGKKSYKVFTEHSIYSSKGVKTKEKASWSLMENESSGTIKAFHLSGPILSALLNGGVLVIDEIEAKMHPNLTREIINSFLIKENNPNNAQLIFATHDTNLLTYSDLRRDQIYFSEKNKWESTEIYSLSDFVYLNETNKHGNSQFEKERPDTDKEKRYVEGRYGAIPIIGNFTLNNSK